MRLSAICLAPCVSLALLAPLVCSADPLVTITCDRDKAVSQDYGLTLADKFAGKPHPQPHLSGPRAWVLADYHSTYIVDSSRKKLTRIDVHSEAIEEVLKLNGETSTPRDVPIIGYLPEVITASESNSLFETTVYSFYPKLGMMFEMGTFYDPTGPTVTQTTYFAKCEYSWSGKP